MTRSDIGVIAIIYATCFLFCYLTLQFKPAAQIYPLCIIGGLALLNTLYLLKRLWEGFKARRDGLKMLTNDLPQIFQGFQARQFFFVATACIAYLFLLRWLGFYLAGFIYLGGVMAWLKVKPLQAIITIGVLGGMIYYVFSILLHVPLPKGIIFG